MGEDYRMHTVPHYLVGEEKESAYIWYAERQYKSAQICLVLGIVIGQPGDSLGKPIRRTTVLHEI